MISGRLRRRPSARDEAWSREAREHAERRALRILRRPARGSESLGPKFLAQSSLAQSSRTPIAMNVASASRSPDGHRQTSFERRQRMVVGKRAHSFGHEIGTSAPVSSGRRSDRASTAFGGRQGWLRDASHTAESKTPGLISVRNRQRSVALIDLRITNRVSTQNHLRQGRVRGPARRHRIERRGLETAAPRQPRGRDIAAKDRQQRRLATPGIETSLRHPARCACLAGSTTIWRRKRF